MLALLPAPQAIHAEAEPRLPAATESGTAFDWSDLQPMFCASVLPILESPFSTELTPEFIRCMRYEFKHQMMRKVKHCVYCGHELAGGKRSACTLDHVIPVSKGGSHFVDNLRLCCRSCNTLKRDMMPQEWAALLQRMAEAARTVLAESEVTA